MSEHLKRKQLEKLNEKAKEYTFSVERLKQVASLTITESLYIEGLGYITPWLAKELLKNIEDEKLERY